MFGNKNIWRKPLTYYTQKCDNSSFHGDLPQHTTTDNKYLAENANMLTTIPHQLCIHINTETGTQTHTDTYMRTRTHTHTYACARTHTHTHTHIHTTTHHEFI